MNNQDLEKMFHLAIGENSHLLEDSSGMDKKSKAFLQKINILRDEQKKILPLYLESQKLVQKHQSCLKTLYNENHDFIPYQLLKIIDKGQHGLDSYKKLLENISVVLKRNQHLTEQLCKYNENLKTLNDKTALIESSIKKLD